MTVPQAVASGGAGASAPDDLVRPRRAAIVAGVIAAAYIFALFYVVPVPGRFVALFGGAPAGVARYGGLVMRWQPPVGADLAALQRLFARRDVGVALKRDGDQVIVEVPHVKRAEAEEVAAIIGAGGVEFREVIESNALADLVNLGLAYEEPRGGYAMEPTLEVDQWRPEDGGPAHTDFYVKARTRHALERMFLVAENQGWHPPPHTVVRYEKIAATQDEIDRAAKADEQGMRPQHRSQVRDSWRSYFVRDAVALDGTAVADATSSYDPNTNRPIVLLDFDRAGGVIFGDLTERITGHKLATLLGGEIVSAPIINGPIRGGRASITMGGSDPAQMERDRDSLVQALRAGQLPIGGTVLEHHYEPASNSAVVELLGRAAIALFGALVAAVLVWLAVRFTRPGWRRSTPLALPANHRALTIRIAWTIGAIAVLIVGMHVPMPGVNDADLTWRFAHGATTVDPSTFSIFTLGFAPLITTFIVVRLAALAVPSWRRLRDTPEGRRRLGVAVAILALIVAGVQGYFVSTYLGSLEHTGLTVFFDDTGQTTWVIVATLVAATAFLAWLASVIGQRGIGNGYAVLIVAAWVARTPRAALDKLDGAHGVLLAVALAAIAVVAGSMLALRIRAARGPAVPVPASGMAPLNSAGGAQLILAQLTALAPIAVPQQVQSWLYTAHAEIYLAGALVVIATLVWSFAFAGPGRRRAAFAKVDLEPPGRDLWLRAFALSATALIAILAIQHTALSGTSLVIGDVTFVVFAVATVADVAAELRARRGALIPVWPLHDPLLLDTARERLDAAGIPHHVQGTRLRTLTWVFGPFVPMMILVPAEHAPAADKLMRDWLAP